MKRTRERDNTIQKDPFMWPSIAPSGVECDHIREAVTAACYKRGTGSYLSRQPIMLYCVGEDVSCHMTLAYWPYDTETGILLLRRLADTKTVTDIDKHCVLVEILVDIACDPYSVHDESEMAKKRRLLTEDTKLNGVKPSEFGLFALIRDDDYKGYDTEPPYMGAHYIEASELATHLYHQECLRFM